MRVKNAMYDMQMIQLRWVIFCGMFHESSITRISSACLAKDGNVCVKLVVIDAVSNDNIITTLIIKMSMIICSAISL